MSKQYTIDHIEDGVIYVEEEENWKQKIRRILKKFGLGALVTIADYVLGSILGIIWVPIKIFIQGIGWVNTNKKKRILVRTTN